MRTKPPRSRSVLVAIVLFVAAVSTPASAAPERPEFQVAIGAGQSFDPEARNAAAVDKPPMRLFFLGLGLGGGLWGVTTRLFANAPGGTQGSPEVQRVGVDLALVVRPFARFRPDSTQLAVRAARTFSLAAGPAVEELLLGSTIQRYRAGLVLDAHGDVPVVPADFAHQLRLRLGVRRVIAPERTMGTRVVRDATADVYLALTLSM